MMRTCFGRDHDLLDMGRDHRRDRGRVAGGLDHDHILLRKLHRKGLEKDGGAWGRLPSSHATASAKARWISSPMTRMPAPSVSNRSKGSWRATRHLLIRARGASGKVGRGGHVTSSGSQPTVYGRS